MLELGEVNVVLERHPSYRTGDKGCGRKKDYLLKLKIFLILCRCTALKIILQYCRIKICAY